MPEENDNDNIAEENEEQNFTVENPSLDLEVRNILLESHPWYEGQKQKKITVYCIWGQALEGQNRYIGVQPWSRGQKNCVKLRLDLVVRHFYIRKYPKWSEIVTVPGILD